MALSLCLDLINFKAECLHADGGNLQVSESEVRNVGKFAQGLNRRGCLLVCLTNATASIFKECIKSNSGGLKHCVKANDSAHEVLDDSGKGKDCLLANGKRNSKLKNSLDALG